MTQIPPGTFTDAVRQVLEQVEYAAQKLKVHYINHNQSWKACIVPTKLTQLITLSQVELAQ